MTDHSQILMTEDEAAELLRLKAQTLSVWRMTGKHIPFVRVGRAVRYRRTDLMAFLESQVVGVKADAELQPA